MCWNWKGFTKLTLTILLCSVLSSFSSMWWPLFSSKWSNSLTRMARILQRLFELWVGDWSWTRTLYQNYIWKVSANIFFYLIQKWIDIKPVDIHHSLTILINNLIRIVNCCILNALKGLPILTFQPDLKLIFYLFTVVTLLLRYARPFCCTYEKYWDKNIWPFI